MKRIALLFAALLAYMGLAIAAVNINTATREQLESLNGIGPVKAQAIIDYRNKNGRFKSLEEIKNVSGIGDATFQKIRGEISLTGSTTAATGDLGPRTGDRKTEAASGDVKKDAKAPPKDAEKKAAKKDEDKKAAKKDEDKKAAKKDEDKKASKKDEDKKAAKKDDDKKASKKDDDKKTSKKVDDRKDAKKDASKDDEKKK